MLQPHPGSEGFPPKPKGFSKSLGKKLPKFAKKLKKNNSDYKEEEGSSPLIFVGHFKRRGSSVEPSSIEGLRANLVPL